MKRYPISTILTVLYGIIRWYRLDKWIETINQDVTSPQVSNTPSQVQTTAPKEVGIGQVFYGVLMIGL